MPNITSISNPSNSRGRPRAPPPFVLTDAEIAALGYIVPTLSPYSADNTGSTDATTSLQNAIDAAYAANKSIWLPSGTYIISDCLRCYSWANKAVGNATTSMHQLYGATYPSRPVIKISDDATAFDNSGSPRPMVAFAKWRPVSSSNQAAPTGPVTSTPTTVNHIPSSGYIAPAAAFWTQATSVLFLNAFYNIDLDTNAKAGAVGLMFPAAQGSYVGNTSITATGGVAGIKGLPGRSCANMNIEVIGGTNGLDLADDLTSIGGTAGIMIAGLTLTGQTSRNLLTQDFVPLVVVGFSFTKPSGSSIATANSAQTCTNGLTLIDGVIDIQSGTAIAVDNTNSQGLYMRNVWIAGTTNLVKSGSASTITGSGTWKHISEYSANVFGSETDISVGTPQNGTSALRHYAYQDGVSTRAQEHVATKEDSAPAPDSDIVTRHVYNFPMVDQGPFINVADLGAAAGTGDSRAGIQAAVAAATAAGHSRVFIPHGVFRVGSGSTAGTITLDANTVMWGCGPQRSSIRPRDAWVPADSTAPYIIDTPSNTEGAACLAFMGVDMRATNSTTDNGKFCHVRWRVGRQSATGFVEYDHDFTNANVTNIAFGRQVFTINGGGGGRHYGHWSDGDCNNGANFRAVQIDSNTQPIAIYGYNCEAAASFGSSSLPESAYPETFMEINNGANIRIYSAKREGQSPTLTLTDCTNVGLFSGGGMRDGEIGTATTPTWVSRYHEIMGTCEGIVMANLFVQSFTNGEATATDYTLYEEESAGGILWPQGISLYKRGYASYDDTLMDFAA